MDLKRTTTILDIADRASETKFSRDVFPSPHRAYRLTTRQLASSLLAIVAARLFAKPDRLNRSALEVVIGWFERYDSIGLI